MNVVLFLGILTALVSMSNGFAIQKKSETKAVSSNQVQPTDPRESSTQKNKSLQNEVENRNEQDSNPIKYQYRRPPSQNTNQENEKQILTNKLQSLINQVDKVTRDVNILHQRGHLKEVKEQAENQYLKENSPRENLRRNQNNKYKRFEIRKRNDVNNYGIEEDDMRQDPNLIDSGAGSGSKRNDDDDHEKPIDPIDQLEKLLKDATKNAIPSSIMMRAKKDLEVKPSFIHFQESSHPTLKLDISSTSIVRALETLMSNPATRRFIHQFGENAVDWLAADELESRRKSSNKRSPVKQ